MWVGVGKKGKLIRVLINPRASGLRLLDLHKIENWETKWAFSRNTLLHRRVLNQRSHCLSRCICNSKSLLLLLVIACLMALHVSNIFECGSHRDLSGNWRKKNWFCTIDKGIIVIQGNYTQNVAIVRWWLHELCSHFDNGLNGRKTPNRINSVEVTTN